MFFFFHNTSLHPGEYLFYNVCFQDLQGQVTAGEEELGQVKMKAEETEGNLRQTVEQLNEVSLFC